MEFEDLNERVEREVKRVAMAFCAQEWTVRRAWGGSDDWWRGQRRDVYQQMVIGTVEGIPIEWYIIGEAIHALQDIVISITWIYVGDGEVWEDLCRLGLDKENMQWVLSKNPRNTFSPYPHFAQIMARGLYRLGFEDDPDVDQIIESHDYQKQELRLTMPPELPPLSAHEKLELRLSMPREFWPQKWLEEEGE